MKNRIFNFLAVILTVAVMAFATSCKDKDTVLSDEFSVYPLERDIVLEADGVNANADGAPFTPTFTVTTNQESWDVTRGKSWITISKTNNSFTLSAKQIDGIDSPDDGWVWVTSGRAKPVKIVVTQMASPPSLEVEGIRNIIFSGDGETATSNGVPIDVPPVFTVTTNVGGWDIKSDKTWLTYTIEDNTFTLSAAMNYTLEPPEEATITVTAGRAEPVIIKVNQEGGELPSLVVEPADIRNITFTGDGKSATSNDTPIDVPPVFTVTTNLESWDINSDKSWLTYTIKDNTFTLTAAANLNFEPREEATVTVTAWRTEPVIIKVNQDAAIPMLEMTGMHNEYTPPGQIIKIYGNYLVDIESTVIYFGDIQTSAIEINDTYLTARVPYGVQPNVKIKAKNFAIGLESVCPGYYQDKNFVITSFDPDFPYTGAVGATWGRIVDAEEAKLSGNCLAFEADAGNASDGLGWWYLMSKSVAYTPDMISNSGNYDLKFELKMSNAITNGVEFYIYYYSTGALNSVFRGADISSLMQDWNVWQTVSIPLAALIPPGAPGADQFNIRPQCYAVTETVNMYFDNFRISKNGD